jgi:uncharacterized protein YecE (DUF72 family)
MTANSEGCAMADANAVKVGCCGFAGTQSDYFQCCELVEVQQTFYEPPRKTTAERWRMRR